MDTLSNADEPLEQGIRPLNDVREGERRILSGWKEIARYLGRGVRTVQRWEAAGLPVRRPHRSLRSAVCATTTDINNWLEGCEITPNSENADERSAHLELRIQRLEAELVSLKQELTRQHRLQSSSVEPISRLRPTA